MKKGIEVTTRDRYMRNAYQQIDRLVGLGHDETDKNQWGAAYQCYEQALATVQKAVKYCTNKGKRTYLITLKSYQRDLPYDLGRCQKHLGDVNKSMVLFEQAYQLGNTNAHEEIIALAFNNRMYQKALDFMLIDDKYQTMGIKGVYDLACRLRFGGKGLKENKKISIVFFQSVLNRTKSIKDDLQDHFEAGILEETIAQCYCEMDNTKEELYWRQKAVDKNLPLALHNYAEMLNDGQGVKRNVKQALTYHLRSAQGGHVDAMLAMTLHLHRSDEIADDLEQAEFWFEQCLAKEPKHRAVVNYCGFLLQCRSDDPQKMQRLKTLLPVVEQIDRDEAVNIRACLILHNSNGNIDQERHAADMLLELANNGLAAAQFNLATLHHTRDFLSTQLAIPLYLEAIEGGQSLARINLYSLMFDLAQEMSGSPEQLLNLFTLIELRYRKSLPLKSRKKDKYLKRYKFLKEELAKGIGGDITELFKLCFPDVHQQFDREIRAVNADITRAARARSTSQSDRIATILEFSLLPTVSARNKTCALRRIGELIYQSSGGHDPLFENGEKFSTLTSQIAQAQLDNEGYTELAIGLAKLKLHPQSRLVNACFVKLHEYHSNNLKVENMMMTPYQAAMLVSALSDLSLQTNYLDRNVITAGAILFVKYQDLNAWQLLKSLQALCVIDAQPTEHRMSQELWVDLFQKLLGRIANLYPAELGMIDRYQLFLSLNYIKNKKICDSSFVRQPFQMAFVEMIGWLRTQKTRPSRSQSLLTDYLRRFRADVSSEKLINGLYVDIFLKDAKVVIEFDGPTHFLAAAAQERLSLVRYPRDFYHQVIVGCPVVRINYLEFDALDHNNSAAIKTFLQKKLAPVGIVLADKLVVAEQLTDTNNIVRHPSRDLGPRGDQHGKHLRLMK